MCVFESKVKLRAALQVQDVCIDIATMALLSVHTYLKVCYLTLKKAVKVQ